MTLFLLIIICFVGYSAIQDSQNDNIIQQYLLEHKRAI